MEMRGIIGRLGSEFMCIKKQLIFVEIFHAKIGLMVQSTTAIAYIWFSINL